MDPLSQGVLGASAAVSVAPRRHAGVAALFGTLGGMAPDLDIFIRSSTDPLLFLEYHRQFTHSLFFIPFGGLIIGSLLWLLLGRRWHFSWTRSVAYATAGYATHALLDTCTTYGTMLLWPFSDARFAWNTVSVIDPLFTVPIVLLLLFAIPRQSRVLARLALAWAVTYPTLGMLQRDRAEAMGWQLAAARGHDPVRLEAKPSFGNILLWKIVYETENHYHVDAVRTGRQLQLFTGTTVEKLDIERDLPWLLADSQQARDLERFRWFSNGYIAKDPRHDYRIIDIRYSMIPNRADGLWSIELSPRAGLESHVIYRAQRDLDEDALDAFNQMLMGQ